MKRNALLGTALVVLGIFIFMSGQLSLTVGTIFAYFWPTLFVIPLGVFFHWLYFSILQRRGIGLVVPGGILLTAGIVCQISMLFDSWSVTWPGFIFAVAVGLFELFWFGNRNKWLLIPIMILTALSLLFFSVFSIGNLLNSQPIVAIVLIILGGWLILRSKNSSF